MTPQVEIEVWQNSAARPDCGLSAIWYATILIDGEKRARVMYETRDAALEGAKRKARELLQRMTTKERFTIPTEDMLQ